MFPCLILASVIYINIYLFGTPCNIDSIREPVAGSLLFGNNIVSGSLIPSSNAIGLHFYPIWITSGLYDWLYNGAFKDIYDLQLVMGVFSGWMLMNRNSVIDYLLGLYLFLHPKQESL